MMLLLALFVVVPAFVLAAGMLPARIVTKPEPGFWFENIAVRPNGDLLITQFLPTAEIITVKNPYSDRAESETLLTLPLAHVLGIDRFSTGKNTDEQYLIVGDNEDKSCSAFTVSFDKGSSGKPSLSRVIDFDANTTFVNGVAAVSDRDNIVLVADSSGHVGRLDISAGTFDTFAFNFPEMKPNQDSPTPLILGVNGIHIRDGYLYFSNTNLASIYRVSITREGFPSGGARPEIITNVTTVGIQGVDDFNLDKFGNIYASTSADDKILYVKVPSGETTVVVQDGVAGNTAMAFGRKPGDTSTLYVVTTGVETEVPAAGGNKTQGAMVAAVDTSKLRSGLT